MPLSAIFNSLRKAGGNGGGERPGAYQANTNKLMLRFWEVVVNFWDLGFTAFGGPPVHFQILRTRFVDEEASGRIPWIDEQAVSGHTFIVVHFLSFRHLINWVANDDCE